MNETKEELDKALKNGLNDGLIMTQGRWCNRINCPKSKINWCKEDICVYGVSLIPDLTQGKEYTK